MRIYDPRLGRFLSVDPITSQYPELTPYQFASNRPIDGIDQDGLEYMDNGMSTDPFKPEDVKGTVLIAPTQGEVLLDGVNHMVNAIIGGIFAPMNAISYDHYAGNAKDAKVKAEMSAKAKEAYTEAAINYGIGKALQGVGTLARWSASKSPALRSFLDDAVWAQKTFNRQFSDGGKFANKTIDDVVSGLKSGKLKVEDVPIEYIIRDGKKFILNTRSSVALTEAGISRNEWYIVDRTGEEFFENNLTDRLKRNKSVGGFETIKESGSDKTITSPSAKTQSNGN